MEKKCERCGTVFETNRSLRKFCSTNCRKASESAAARARRRLLPKEVDVCEATDCAFYEPEKENHCDILASVPPACNFFKPFKVQPKRRFY